MCGIVGAVAKRPIAEILIEGLKRKKGYVLICIAYPTSDCTIRTHAEDEMY